MLGAEMQAGRKAEAALGRWGWEGAGPIPRPPPRRAAPCINGFLKNKQSDPEQGSHAQRSCPGRVGEMPARPRRPLDSAPAPRGASQAPSPCVLGVGWGLTLPPASTPVPLTWLCSGDRVQFALQKWGWGGVAPRGVSATLSGNKRQFTTQRLALLQSASTADLI